MTTISSKIVSVATVLAAATCITLLSSTHAAALDYTFSRTIGDSSNLIGPFGVAFDSSSNLYTSNFYNNIITKFKALVLLSKAFSAT